MSGEQMRVDYDRLADLEQNLSTAVRVVGREFENMAALSFAVGDNQLAHRTNQFRDSWDKKRIEIVDNLEWLRDSVMNIRTQLADTDAALASGLTAPATGGGSTDTEAV